MMVEELTTVGVMDIKGEDISVGLSLRVTLIRGTVAGGTK